MMTIDEQWKARREVDFQTSWFDILTLFRPVLGTATIGINRFGGVSLKWGDLSRPKKRVIISVFPDGQILANTPGIDGEPYNYHDLKKFAYAMMEDILAVERDDAMLRKIAARKKEPKLVPPEEETCTLCAAQ